MQDLYPVKISTLYALKPTTLLLKMYLGSDPVYPEIENAKEVLRSGTR
jgi:hypothetical protein